MHQIEIGDAQFSLPGMWAEIPPGKMLDVMPHLFALDRAEAQAELVRLLSNIPDTVLAYLQPWQYAEIMALTDWLWTEPIREPAWTELEGWVFPAKEGSNMTLLEYYHAEGFLLAFTEGDADALHKLCATILRRLSPSDSFVDRRTAFDPYRLDHDVAAQTSLDVRVKLYALWLMHGYRACIREQFAYLWTGEEDGDVRGNINFGDDEEIDFGWIGTAYSVAEQGVFGDFNAVLRTDIHTVLYYLCHKKQEASRRERETESRRDRSPARLRY
ncbi:MAG: hypothetical protein ACK4Q5_05990 [Saprospiraceae bacterium]